VQIPAARIYNLPTARMYSFVCPSDSPPGGSQTVPRTVSRTALREDLRNSNGHPDSPSRGHPKLQLKLGQPFGRHSRTKTETTISLQSCTHTVSSIRQGFAVQNQFPPEPRQPFGSTKLFRWEGERMPDHAWLV